MNQQPPGVGWHNRRNSRVEAIENRKSTERVGKTSSEAERSNHLATTNMTYFRSDNTSASCCSAGEPSSPSLFIEGRSQRIKKRSLNQSSNLQSKLQQTTQNRSSATPSTINNKNTDSSRGAIYRPSGIFEELF